MQTSVTSLAGSYDLARLRRDRLRKLKTAMKERDIGALVLTNPVNVRYATGVSVMDLWTSVNLARYAVVPAHGDPQLFEYGKSLFLAKAVWPETRAAKAWQYRFSQHEFARISKAWAEEIKSVLTERGVAGGRVGYDVLDFFGHQALVAAGLTLADADEPVVAAKLIKTPDEIEFLRRSCAIAEAALHDLEKAIRPGVTENELSGVFWHKMLALGGEHCSTRLLTAGQKTNPWFYESGDNIVRPGDVVGIDTDMTGPEGYLCDISRTFLCGDKADAEQREAYRVAYDFIHATMELCRPGTEYQELLEKAPKVPLAYQAQGYSCMMHGTGYDDEPPFLPYAHEKGAVVPRGRLMENMVLSMEFYAGKVGARSGVKLEEQFLVTANGAELLSKYPFEERLLS